jgi:hypothetical protein
MQFVHTESAHTNRNRSYRSRRTIGSVSLTSRPVVPTVVRGGGTWKNSRHTSSKAEKLLRSVRKTCAFTTSLSDVPAAANVLAKLCSTNRVCNLISEP